MTSKLSPPSLVRSRSKPHWLLTTASLMYLYISIPFTSMRSPISAAIACSSIITLATICCAMSAMMPLSSSGCAFAICCKNKLHFSFISSLFSWSISCLMAAISAELKSLRFWTACIKKALSASVCLAVSCFKKSAMRLLISCVSPLMSIMYLMVSSSTCSVSIYCSRMGMSCSSFSRSSSAFSLPLARASSLITLAMYFSLLAFSLGDILKKLPLVSCVM